ncbi:hypothetical protein Taro_056026 [Colocasia esculenta]|uniref:Uncharacterized protein n=1 Tax=Colocasia esculenta TaxID=4460 RepID=A0A843XUK8_COLES|nr:hypothetical protein [Colocasia esculenta]
MGQLVALWVGQHVSRQCLSAFLFPHPSFFPGPKRTGAVVAAEAQLRARLSRERGGLEGFLGAAVLAFGISGAPTPVESDRSAVAPGTQAREASRGGVGAFSRRFVLLASTRFWVAEHRRSGDRGVWVQGRGGRFPHCDGEVPKHSVRSLSFWRGGGSVASRSRPGHWQFGVARVVVVGACTICNGRTAVRAVAPVELSRSPRLEAATQTSAVWLGESVTLVEVSKVMACP